MPSVEGFERMKLMLEELGHPESGLKILHIAGTNGKGSTAVMISSILEQAGYSIGLFTSPHLELECERLQLWDGTHKMIPQDHFEELMERAREARRKVSDNDESLFDIYTAAAYLWFSEVKPDYAVMECGLGGRLDMTNTIEKPLVSVITQVGLDHTAELGNTIFKVAREKAGIIKPGVPVVSGSPEPLVSNIFKKTAEEKGCSFIDASLQVDRYKDYVIGMQGAHQLRNAATAVSAVKAAGIEVSEEAVRNGLSKAVLSGRFEILREKPYWIIDGAHNPQAMEALAETFNGFARRNKIRRTLFIFGCMKDKDCRRMINIMTDSLRGVSYAAAAVDYERAQDPEIISEMFADNGRKCVFTGSVRDAFDYAKTSGYECVITAGSIYIAGEMRELFSSKYSD